MVNLIELESTLWELHDELVKHGLPITVKAELEDVFTKVLPQVIQARRKKGLIS